MPETTEGAASTAPSRGDPEDFTDGEWLLIEMWCTMTEMARSGHKAGDPIPWKYSPGRRIEILRPILDRWQAVLAEALEWMRSNPPLRYGEQP